MFIIGNGGKTTDHLIITDVKKGSVAHRYIKLNTGLKLHPSKMIRDLNVFHLYYYQ
jgi:hypothetical protein